jgi:hypothetical protein
MSEDQIVVLKTPFHTDLRALPEQLVPFLKTSVTHPLHISWVLPTQLECSLSDVSIVRESANGPTSTTSDRSILFDANPTEQSAPSTTDAQLSLQIKRSRSSALESNDQTLDEELEESGLQSRVPIIHIRLGQRPSSESAKAMMLLDGPTSRANITGNLALSSCPGKKVRLDGRGVTKARVPIFRTLDDDFARIAASDITAIVKYVQVGHLT